MVNQDMPPKEGFPTTIRYQRYLPARGPSGALIFTLITGVTLYGFYELSLVKNEERQLKNEKAWARIYLGPLLQAEYDRDRVRTLDNLKRKEETLMEKVEGFAMDLKTPMKGLLKDLAKSVPVYHTERYIAPSMVFLAGDDKDVIPAQSWRTSHWLGIKNNPYHERWDWVNRNTGPPMVIED